MKSIGHKYLHGRYTKYKISSVFPFINNLYCWIRLIHYIKAWIKIVRNQMSLLCHFEAYNHCRLLDLTQPKSLWPVLICCHSLYLWLLLVVPVVATLCTTSCHSLTFFVIRSLSLHHSLSLNVSLVCLFINNQN